MWKFNSVFDRGNDLRSADHNGGASRISMSADLPRWCAGEVRLHAEASSPRGLCSPILFTLPQDWLQDESS